MKRPSRRPASRAVERNEARRAGGLRLVRTIVLGTLATVAAIVWLGEQYGVDRAVMLEFLATAGLFVAVLVVLGLAGAVVLWGGRRLYSRSLKKRSERGT